MTDYLEFRFPIKPDTDGKERSPSFTGTKTLDGRQYMIWIRYMKNNGIWYIDITSMSDPSVSIKGKALLPGKDLFRPHGYGNILGELWVEDTSGANENPTYEGMGDRWRLRYYPLQS